MYKIYTETTKADIQGMEQRLKEMMKRGIRVSELQSWYSEFNRLCQGCKDKITKEYDIENPNSSKQVISYLQDLANSIVDKSEKNDIVNICLDDKTGKWTSNAEAMNKLADLGYEIAEDILEYRKMKKYSDSVMELITNSDKDKLVHPIINLSKTNRITYSKPGIMSIPKALLWGLIAPYNSADTLYSVDIKNQEPSILINYLNDEDLKKCLMSDKGLYEELFERVFKPVVEMNIINDGLDCRIYNVDEMRTTLIEPEKYLPKKAPCRSWYYNDKEIIAVETLCQGFKDKDSIKYPDSVVVQTSDNNMYMVPVIWRKDFRIKKSDDFKIIGDLQGVEIRLSKAERREFKTSWNALSYGGSYMALDRACKILDYKPIYKYFTGLKSFKAYKDKITSFAKAGSCTVNTVFGNWVTAVGKDDFKSLQRSLLDLPIQGTGADILSCLIKHFEEEVEKSDKFRGKAFIYYTRHDELIIEVAKGLDENEVKTFLKETLEHQIITPTSEWVPFKVEINKIDHVDVAQMLDSSEE